MAIWGKGYEAALHYRDDASSVWMKIEKVANREGKGSNGLRRLLNWSRNLLKCAHCSRQRDDCVRSLVLIGVDPKHPPELL